MDAGGLQRSDISFRRTGSSGLVWDDKFLSELAKIKPASQDATDPERISSADPAVLQRSRSDGGVAGRQGYKTMKEPSPSVDPPSPKMSGCAGICSVFRGGHPSQKEKQVRSKRGKIDKRRV
ncbi:hypothetical protein QQ045_004488 [Rhodiola kirilowii]